YQRRANSGHLKPADLPSPAGTAETTMNVIKSVFAVGLLAFGLATPALAQSALDQVKAAGVLRVGTEGTYPPFTYHDDSNALVGFDVEIAQEIAKRIGVTAEF